MWTKDRRDTVAGLVCKFIHDWVLKDCRCANRFQQISKPNAVCAKIRPSRAGQLLGTLEQAPLTTLTILARTHASPGTICRRCRRKWRK